jgi:hypothetical protein
MYQQKAECKGKTRFAAHHGDSSALADACAARRFAGSNLLQASANPDNLISSKPRFTLRAAHPY